MSIKKIVFSPLGAISLTILVGLLVWSLEKNRHEIDQAVEKIETAQNETNQLQAQLDSINKAIDAAQTPLAKEKIWRNELLLQKDGEYVLMLVYPSPTPAPTDFVSPEANWRKWWELFK